MNSSNTFTDLSENENVRISPPPSGGDVPDNFLRIARVAVTQLQSTELNCSQLNITILPIVFHRPDLDMTWSLKYIQHNTVTRALPRT